VNGYPETEDDATCGDWEPPEGRVCGDCELWDDTKVWSMDSRYSPCVAPHDDNRTLRQSSTPCNMPASYVPRTSGEGREG